MEKCEAVEAAFESASSEMKLLDEAAAILRRHVEAAYAQTSDVPWPPSAAQLMDQSCTMPQSVMNFMYRVICGKPLTEASTKTNRLAKSLTEDICCTVTRGMWKLPKQILLGVSLHHLTGRADIMTILNRFGHCSSYPMILELETAVANQVQQQSSVIPSCISQIGNKVCYLCWDNFDINEETPSGAGTTHTTHGIVIQEITDVAVQADDQSVPRTKERTFKYVPSTISPCYSRKKVEPALRLDCTDGNSAVCSTAAIQEHTRTHSVELSDFEDDKLDGTAVFSTRLAALWTVCRSLYNATRTVPDWCGWISKTSEAQETAVQSQIGYMQPILHPITEYATVQQCLLTSMDVAKALQQRYTLVTMDLAAARIAYDIIWDGGEKFADVILCLGAFHTMCSFMGSLGKLMTSSGFEDILIESGICASGSIDQVMSGKHYNRSMRVHMLMLDAMERMLMEVFVDMNKDEENGNQYADVPTIGILAGEPTRANVMNACDDSSCMEFVDKYERFKDTVRDGNLGKTAQFWLMYCFCVWVLMRFQQAVRLNDFYLYRASMQEMCHLLFSADHVHYARYLTVHWMQLEHIDQLHPGAPALLMENGFSVSRSAVPGCRNPIDLTIEQTINPSATTAGGIVGFSRNASAYYRWCLTRHKRASFIEATFQEADMVVNSSDVHKSNRPSALKRSEDDVASVVSAVKRFLNPFQIEGDNQQQLYCLSSGQPATSAVAADLLRYVDVGKDAAELFVNSRLITKAVQFHQPIRKQNLLTFKAMATKCKLTTTKQKSVQVRAERNLLGRLLLLSQSNDVSLEKLFAYQLGPIPWSIATTDGSLVKTDKAQLMHCLEETAQTVADGENKAPVDRMYIVDGNAHIQSMTHLPATFEELAHAIFCTLPKAVSSTL